MDKEKKIKEKRDRRVHIRLSNLELQMLDELVGRIQMTRPAKVSQADVIISAIRLALNFQIIKKKI